MAEAKVGNRAPVRGVAIAIVIIMVPVAGRCSSPWSPPGRRRECWPAEISAEMLRDSAVMKRRLREGVEFVSFLRKRKPSV